MPTWFLAFIQHFWGCLKNILLKTGNHLLDTYWNTKQIMEESFQSVSVESNEFSKNEYITVIRKQMRICTVTQTPPSLIFPDSTLPRTKLLLHICTLSIIILLSGFFCSLCLEVSDTLLYTTIACLFWHTFSSYDDSLIYTSFVFGGYLNCNSSMSCPAVNILVQIAMLT